MIRLSTLFAAIVVSIFATAAIIYVTPLKHIALVEPTVYDIDPHAFNEDFTKNPDDYVFIDVRPESAYVKLHAKGSISMPLHTLYDERHTLPKYGKNIVLICSGGRASGVGYSYLQHYGFRNIARIEGGIENWAIEELPTEGSAVIMLDPETSPAAL
ncbi:MAG: rhodanese-like domain-containing protein [Candidatus Pacebacteria bacterium]|nr:rhodanese-like domain-containing protein [Candidatus Paceibacterota bacterium]